MLAVKDNKCYTITEAEKKRFQSLGYDIQDENGKVIAKGHGKKVEYEKYEALEAENKKLEAENKKLKAQLEKLKKEQ